MYEVTIDMENLPKGADVEIDGLGMFKNGSTVEVSNEEAEAFRQHHQTVEYEYDEEGHMAQKVTLGPTVLEAFKSVDGFAVKKMKPQDDDNKPKGGNDNA